MVIDIDALVIVNFVTTIITFIVCIEIARRWKRRKKLMIGFAGAGITHLLCYIFFVYWLFYGNLYALATVAIAGILYGSFVSVGVLNMLYSPKRPFNWLLVVYLFIPVIYTLTGSIEVTSFKTMSLGSLITFSSFFLIVAIGKKKMKIYGATGMAAALMTMVYLSMFASGVVIGYFWFIVNLLLAFAFAGFWSISSKNPKHFVADYDGKKDGR
jgi:hypothetical protein